MIRKSILVCASLSAILLSEVNAAPVAPANGNLTTPELSTSISNIEITGFGNEDETTKMLEVIGLKRGDLYEESSIDKAKAIILAKLKNDGIQDTSVDVKTTKVGTSGMSVIFDVKKGHKIKIKKQSFNGASALSHSELEKNLINKEEDFMGWLPLRSSGVAYIDQLEADAYRLKDMYMQHGYLDVQVSRPSMKIDTDKYAEIVYDIKEGNQYKNGKIVVEQSIDGLNSDELSKSLSLREGRVFNIANMRKDMQFLQDQSGNLGYAATKVEPKIRKNDNEKTIDLVYVVSSGKQFKVNDVLISGNEVTLDKVIRRNVYSAPGDIFSLKDLKDSKNALGRTGYFESVEVTPQPVGEDTVNLLVKVKEAPTGSIAVGAGYGSQQKFMLNGSVSDKNLFGSGIDASIGADVSAISTNFTLGITNPRLWDSEYSLALDIFKKDYEYTDYTIDQAGGSLTLGKQFMRNYYGYLGLGYSDNQSSATNLVDTQSLFYNDKYNKISLMAGVKFDNTDDFYTPRSGFIVSGGAEIAKLGGTITSDQISGGYSDFADIVKFNAKFGAYYGLNDLIDYDLILRYKARFNMVHNLSGGYVPPSERLFLGGSGSVRGYESYSISPQRYLGKTTVTTNSDGTTTITIRPDGTTTKPITTKTPTSPTPIVTGPTESYGLIGGTKTFSNAIEASIPISEEAKMRLTGFVDYGIIASGDYYNISYPNISRYSVGAAIEWFSPFGPVNFIFAKAMNPGPYDREASFEFTMGSKF